MTGTLLAVRNECKQTSRCTGFNTVKTKLLS